MLEFGGGAIWGAVCQASTGQCEIGLLVSGLLVSGILVSGILVSAILVRAILVRAILVSGILVLCAPLCLRGLVGLRGLLVLAVGECWRLAGLGLLGRLPARASPDLCSTCHYGGLPVLALGPSLVSSAWVGVWRGSVLAVGCWVLASRFGSSGLRGCFATSVWASLRVRGNEGLDLGWEMVTGLRLYRGCGDRTHGGSALICLVS